MLHDYTQLGAIEAIMYAQLMDAPDSSCDIALAWNTVEAAENRKNSTHSQGDLRAGLPA